MKSCKARYTWVRTPGGATWLNLYLEPGAWNKLAPQNRYLELPPHRSCLSFLLSQCYLEFLLELHVKSFLGCFHSVIVNNINKLRYLINQLGIKWTLSRRSDLATIS